MAGSSRENAARFRRSGRDATILLARAWVLLGLLASSGFAELPAARLTAVFPPGGRAGTNVDVTVSGKDLDGAAELRFSRPGIAATPSGESSSAVERKFTVAIGPDVPVGECEVRFLGASGISNPRAFSVSDRPEVVRIAGDKRPEPMPIGIGSIVNARCTAGSIDSYAVELRRGQRTLFDCAARQIDSKMSPVMVLVDADSHEMARSRHGGLLDFTARANGTYTLQLHDLLYRGGPECFYRLEVGVAPHLDAIFPPAGQRGTKGRFTLLGRNLPGGTTSDLRAIDGLPLEQLDVEIELPVETSAPPRLDASVIAGTSGWSADAFPYRLSSDQGASNPILIGLLSSPLTLEREPNDTPGQAQKLDVPAEVAGRFYPHGDRDWYRFDAVKGEAYWIDIVSHRMGLPSSPFVLVQRVTRNGTGGEQVSDVQETPVASASPVDPVFRSSIRDGAFRLEARDGGLYRLMVRDLFNSTYDNASLTYRLSIRKEQPDFRILALSFASPTNEVSVWSPFLRKGGALPLRLTLARQDGFNGEVRIDAEGLPAGLKCRGATIPAGQSAGILVLSAEDDAANWCGPVRLIGRATANHEQITREARIGTVIWPGNPNIQEPAVSRLAEDFILAVSGDEKEPITLDVGDKPYVATAGRKVEIGVKVRRNLEIKTPLRITPGGLPAVSGAKELVLAPEASAGALEIDLSQQKLAPGQYSFFLQAQAQVAYQRRSFSMPGKKGDGKGPVTIVPVTCYSSPIILNVVARGEGKDK